MTSQKHAFLYPILLHPKVLVFTDENGNTWLHIFASMGLKYLPELMHLHFVDLGRVKNAEGITPLHLFAIHGGVEVLTHPDAAVVKDNRGLTPLHLLAAQGVVEVLKHPSANTSKDNLGRTPLHLAAHAGVIAALCHEDVDTVKDKSGMTPLDYATKAGHKRPGRA